MVTGRPASAAKTQASLIGAILKDERARMSAVQPLAPSGLDRVVMACLAKDPDGRWQSAADIARELTWVATAPSDPAPQPVVSTTGRHRERLAWMAAMALILAVAGVGLWRSRTQPVSDGGPVLRARLPLAAALAIGSNGHPTVAVSPDGRYIACRAGTPAQLYLRNMGDTEARAIEGTVDASYQSNRTGRPEVYVQAFPAAGGASPVSNAGGTKPMWRGDHGIVYRRGQSVMSVPIATAPTLHAGEPVELFRTPNSLVDVMPNGRLLMVTATLAPPVTELEIVVNWFQDLRKKMAAGR